jgi:hypothetical protein
VLEAVLPAGTARRLLLQLRCCQSALKVLLLLYCCCELALHLMQVQQQLLLQLQVAQSSALWPGCLTEGAVQHCCLASKWGGEHLSGIAHPRASHCMLAAAALDLQELLL